MTNEWRDWERSLASRSVRTFLDRSRIFVLWSATRSRPPSAAGPTRFARKVNRPQNSRRSAMFWFVLTFQRTFRCWGTKRKCLTVNFKAEPMLFLCSSVRLFWSSRHLNEQNKGKQQQQQQIPAPVTAELFSSAPSSSPLRGRRLIWKSLNVPQGQLGLQQKCSSLT